MAINRHSAQRFLEEENDAHIEKLLGQVKELGVMAGDINIEIRKSVDEIDKIVRVCLCAYASFGVCWRVSLSWQHRRS